PALLPRDEDLEGDRRPLPRRPRELPDRPGRVQEPCLARVSLQEELEGVKISGRGRVAGAMVQMQGGATKSMQAHRRGATTQQMRRAARNPEGAWGLGGEYGVARRARPLGSALLLAPCLRPPSPRRATPSRYFHTL